jgi:predicted RNA binding protein YcfA (HicA-like mRNA interferase family)
MKRRDLIRHLERNGCVLLREGKHTIYANGSRRAAVPRHSEIANLTADRICDDLAIPRLEKK